MIRGCHLIPHVGQEPLVLPPDSKYKALRITTAAEPRGPSAGLMDTQPRWRGRDKKVPVAHGPRYDSIEVHWDGCNVNQAHYIA